MDLYILNSVYQREYVVDDFESLIWTERFSAIGEFELTMSDNTTHRNDIQIGTMLRLDRSTRIMFVEVIENRIDESGKRVRKIKGSSSEFILKARVARESLKPTQDADGKDVGNWSITGTPADIVRTIFMKTCANEAENSLDNLKSVPPDFDTGIENQIPEIKDKVTVEVELVTVYDAIKNICEIYDFGFFMSVPKVGTFPHFYIYMGRDLTTSQTKNASVLFTPELDNLTNVSEVESSVDTYNVAYVYSPVLSLEVFPEGIPPDIEDFERRVLIVKAEGVDKDAVNPADILKQQGRAELAKRRQIKVFDGEVRQDSQYIYGLDYLLGDIVEVRNTDGESNRMRVSEQIFVSDKAGERSYPTLEQYQYVNKGSWISWESNKQWIDYDKDPTTWSELP